MHLLNVYTSVNLLLMTHKHLSNVYLFENELPLPALNMSLKVGTLKTIE